MSFSGINACVADNFNLASIQFYEWLSVELLSEWLRMHELFLMKDPMPILIDCKLSDYLCTKTEVSYMLTICGTLKSMYMYMYMYMCMCTIYNVMYMYVMLITANCILRIILASE
jgi:hypothetical protein